MRRTARWNDEPAPGSPNTIAFVNPKDQGWGEKRFVFGPRGENGKGKRERKKGVAKNFTGTSKEKNWFWKRENQQTGNW